MTSEKFWRNIKSVFLATKGSISSKRVCGFLGWLTCLAVLVYCTILTVQAPLFADGVLIATTALLGVDSITGIWKVNNKQKNETYTEEDS